VGIVATKVELEARIRQHRRAVLVVNPGSRSGDDLVSGAAALLEARGLTLAALHVVDGDLDAAVDAALADDPDLLVLASGDGTLSRVVGRLAHRDTVLGVLPTGTTNNFARTLGIPVTLEGALDVLADGTVAEVDLGTMDGQHFANVAALGISVSIAQSVPDGLKRVLGRGAYALEGIRCLFRHRHMEVTVETDQGDFAYGTHEVIVANGRFHAGTLIAPDVSADDHHLVVFHLGDRRRAALLRSLVLFALHRPRTLREGNFVRVQRARITTTVPQDLEVDGEVRGRTPVTFGVDRDALKVLVPAEPA
jgi:YegS/Rv2252/BmrU family lipid kinase